MNTKNAWLVSCFIAGLLIGWGADELTPDKKNPATDAIAVTGGSSTVEVYNGAETPVVVYIAFGSDSVVLPSAWSFCTGSGLNCQFSLGARATQVLPLSGKYLNATIAFNSPVGCGATKAELNVNNPAWYDTLDVSLVDGYSNNILIEVADRGTNLVLGPPRGKTGNERVFGVFPYGCDCCTKRQDPPCGIPAGGPGCKGGTQYHPDVPCQWQGSVMGGGTKAKVSLVVGTPA
jgi:hypothetical protein